METKPVNFAENLKKYRDKIARGKTQAKRYFWLGLGWFIALGIMAILRTVFDPSGIGWLGVAGFLGLTGFVNLIMALVEWEAARARTEAIELFEAWSKENSHTRSVVTNP